MSIIIELSLLLLYNIRVDSFSKSSAAEEALKLDHFVTCCTALRHYSDIEIPIIFLNPSNAHHFGSPSWEATGVLVVLWVSVQIGVYFHPFGLAGKLSRIQLLIKQLWNNSITAGFSKIPNWACPWSLLCWFVGSSHIVHGLFLRLNISTLWFNCSEMFLQICWEERAFRKTWVSTPIQQTQHAKLQFDD